MLINIPWINLEVDSGDLEINVIITKNINSLPCQCRTIVMLRDVLTQNHSWFFKIYLFIALHI
jgi:hypothetical protein